MFTALALLFVHQQPARAASASVLRNGSAAGTSATAMAGNDKTVALASVISSAGSTAEFDPKVVHGDDHRRDYYQLNPNDSTDALALSLLHNAIMAQVSIADLGLPDSDGIYRVLDDYPDYLRLGPSRNMCDGQRFLRDPSLSRCSSTLVGPSQVITAGHCVWTEQDCENYVYVFNYYVIGYDSNGDPMFPKISVDDVYSCASYSTEYAEDASSPPRSIGGLDIAYITLDRPVVGGRNPATYRNSLVPTTVGQKLLMIGFPSRQPAKVDDGGTVTHTGASGYEEFMASVDSFQGNSGSGVFDENGIMIGVLVRGEKDYVNTGSCTEVNVRENAAGQEAITYVHNVLDLTSPPICSYSVSNKVIGEGTKFTMRTFSQCDTHRYTNLRWSVSTFRTDSDGHVILSAQWEDQNVYKYFEIDGLSDDYITYNANPVTESTASGWEATDARVEFSAHCIDDNEWCGAATAFLASCDCTFSTTWFLYGDLPSPDGGSILNSGEDLVGIEDGSANSSTLVLPIIAGVAVLLGSIATFLGYRLYKKRPGAASVDVAKGLEVNVDGVDDEEARAA